MWPLKTILCFGLFWFGCFAALVNPIWGVANYMMVYQANPAETWWGAPLAESGMRFSMLAAAFTLVGVVTGRKYTPRVTPVLSLWEVGLVLIVACGGITLLVGYGVHTWSLFAFEKLWKSLLFVFVLGRLATTRVNLKIVLWILVIGSLYVGWDAFTAPSSAFWMGRLELIGGPDFVSSSGTAAHLSAMLPLIGVAFLIARRWRWRLLAAAAGAFALNAIILCRTRSAFIGLLCGLMAAAVMAPRAKRFRIHLLLALGVVAAINLTDEYFWARISTLTDRQTLEQDPATVNRVELWGHAAALLADWPQGVGPGNFRRAIGQYDPKYYNRSAHNTLIICFTELGVAGGIIFVSLLLGSVYFIVQIARLADRSEDPTETRLLAYGFLISMTTYFVTGLGTERFYCESFWWVLVLPMCLYRVVFGEARAAAPVPLRSEVNDDSDALIPASPQPQVHYGW